MRALNADDSALFASWEAAERPYPWSRSQFEAVSRDAGWLTVVAPATGRPVGFAAAQLADDEAYLANVFVAACARRRGWAARILAALGSRLENRRIRRIWLEVDVSNSPAIALYEANGFARVQIRPAAYPKGEAAVSMMKALILSEENT